MYFFKQEVQKLYLLYIRSMTVTNKHLRYKLLLELRGQLTGLVANFSRSKTVGLFFLSQFHQNQHRFYF